MNAEFVAAVERVTSRMEAALGADAGSFGENALADSTATPEMVVRVVAGDLFDEPDDVDFLIDLMKGTANASLLAIAQGATPGYPIIGSLVQSFAVGVFYGRATP